MKKPLAFFWYSIVAAAAVLFFPTLCLAKLIPALSPVKAIELPPPHVTPVKAIELKPIEAKEAPYSDEQKKITQVAANIPAAQSDKLHTTPSLLPVDTTVHFVHREGSSTANFNPQVY